jgi:hypothetical protein
MPQLLLEVEQHNMTEKVQTKKKPVDSTKLKKKKEDFSAPVHTTIPVVLFCPFDNCNSNGPFKTLESVVSHLKKTHNIILAQPKCVKPFLQNYLQLWKNEFEKGNKEITSTGTVQD